MKYQNKTNQKSPLKSSQYSQQPITKSNPVAKKIPSPDIRHPSPIVYDHKSHPISEIQSSPTKSYSPEEQLYYDRQPRDIEYK